MSTINENILLKIYEELQETKEQLKVLPNMEQQLNQITSKEIPEIKKQLEEIPKMKEDILEMKKQLEEIPKMKKQLEEIPKMKEDILEMKKQLEEIPKMKKQLEEIPKMKNDIESMKQELRNISGSVARIEVEHGEKLVALFDAFKVNSEKIEEHDKKINKCENRLTSHDDQLYVLNSKVGNL